MAQAEVRVLQGGAERTLRVKLRSPHRMVPVHIRGRPPSYFILGGLVFTQVCQIWLSQVPVRIRGSRVPDVRRIIRA